MNIVNFSVGDLYIMSQEKLNEKFHNNIKRLDIGDEATDLVLETEQLDRIPRLFRVVEIVYKNPMCKVYNKRKPKFYIFRCIS